MAFALVLSLVSIHPDAGTAGFDFVRIAPTAREAAMGAAGIAGADGPMGFWYSPANALASTCQRAHLGYVSYVAGIQLGSAAFSQPVDERTGMGVGVVYLNSGTMKRTDEQGRSWGTFGVSYLDLNLSGGMRFGDFAELGAGIQGLYGSIDTFFSLGLAGNVGATFRDPSGYLRGLTLGVAVSNLGLTLKSYGSEKEPMPMQFAAGLGYRFSTVRLLLDVHQPLDNRLQFRAGIEGWANDVLALRAGYNSYGPDLQSGGGADILAGLSTGLGIRYKGYQLDYSFTPMVELGMAHRLSLSLNL